MGLFEVVAHDLVQLDQVASALFEPEGEACVQFRPDRLGERVIGGVSDQQVAETKRVLAWELRPVRSDQLLPYQSAKAGRHVGRFRSKRLDCAAVEHLTLDRAALEHASLRFVELVKTGRQQRLDRRRHRNLAVARFLRQRQHLLHEERVSAGRGADPATGRSSASPRTVRKRSVSAGVSGSSSEVVALSFPPAQPGRRSSSSGRAIHRSSIGASRLMSATCSTRSRNASSAH